MQRNAIALDMEASAFIQLCDHFGNDYAKCLGVVKGISDFGNSEKGKDENTYSEALKNTALALQEWITHSIPVVNWEVDESTLAMNPLFSSTPSTSNAILRPGAWSQDCPRLLQKFCEQSPRQLLPGLGGHDEERHFGCGKYFLSPFFKGLRLIENRSLETRSKGSRLCFPKAVNQHSSAKWEI